MNILGPVFALAGLTLCMVGLIGFRRVRSAARGRVVPDDFRYGESENVTEDARIANRNYMNLLELPVLFYVASILAYVTQHGDAILVPAWIYVALRFGHSVVHLTYNHVLHRAALFALSNFVLVGIWIRLFVALV